jgi:hypothetical protein
MDNQRESSEHSAGRVADEAWHHYWSTIDAVRTRMLSRDEAQRHPRVREQALYLLQTAITGGNQMYIQPRADYPAFYNLWGPFETLWGGPASDFRYYWAFIDGQRTYRVWGKSGTTCLTDFQVFTGHFGDESMRALKNYDINEFQRADNGDFEVIVSPHPHPGNWIALDRGDRRCFLHVRDIFGDWNVEHGVELHIECLDRQADTLTLSEEEIALRLRKAARMIEQNIARALGYAKRIRQLAGGPNAFGEVLAQGGRQEDHGASTRAGYFGLVWDIAPNEALIIEGEAVPARYWSLQLYDLWWGALDYTFHQSGLNHTQMQADGDGRFCAVLSFDDPGVPNWLDPLRTPVGQIMMRWYDGGPARLPAVRKVKQTEIRAYLPVNTPSVAPQERQAALVLRARASMRRWNY